MFWFKKSKFNGREYREETSRKFRGDTGFAFLTLLSQFLLVVVMPFSLTGQTPYSVKFISLSASLGHFSFVFLPCICWLFFRLSFIIKNHRTFRWLNGDYCDNLHHIAAV